MTWVEQLVFVNRHSGTARRLYILSARTQIVAQIGGNFQLTRYESSGLAKIEADWVVYPVFSFMPKNQSESFFSWLRNQIFDFNGKNNVRRYPWCVPFFNWECLGQNLNVWDKCLQLLCPQVLTITHRLTCTSAHRCAWWNGVTLAITSPLAFFPGQIHPKTLCVGFLRQNYRHF